MNIHVFAVDNVALSHWKPIVKLSSVCLSGEDKECPVYHHLAQEQHVWVGWPTGGDLQDGQLYQVGDCQPKQLSPTSTGSQCQQLRHSQITDQLMYRNTCSNKTCLRVLPVLQLQRGTCSKALCWVSFWAWYTNLWEKILEVGMVICSCVYWKF